MGQTLDLIGRAAYERWERRGWAHGFDRRDWFAAERHVRFASSYRVIAAVRAGDSGPAPTPPGRRACRFCGAAEPRAAFPGSTPLFPLDGGPLAFDQCDDCARSFARGIDADLARFLADAAHRPPSGVPTPAFKGLVKLALALLPARDLGDLEDAVEWVANDDHDLDFNVFRGLSCLVHESDRPVPAPWAALARRTDDDRPWPSDLLFFGHDRFTYQVAIPMNPRDEDQDVTGEDLPDVLPPSPYGIEHDPIDRRSVPIAASGRVRELAGAGRD